MATPFGKLNRFNLSHEVYGTYNMGLLYPNLLMEVVPGDSFDVNSATFARFEAMIAPQLSQIDMMQYYFYVPNRILMKDWESYITGGFKGDDTTVKPFIEAPEGGFKIGSLADYFGLPTGVANIQVSALPFRAYEKIYYDWFANENVTDIPDELTLSAGKDTTTSTDLKKKNWEKDYFTSVLPTPQRGQASYLPVGTWAPTGVYPIGAVVEKATNSMDVFPPSMNGYYNVYNFWDQRDPAPTVSYGQSANRKLSVPFVGDGSIEEGSPDQYFAGQPLQQFSDQMSSTTISYLQGMGSQHSSSAGPVAFYGLGSNEEYGRTQTDGPGNSSDVITNSPTGLMGLTDLTSATAVSINAMRTAFQIQRFLEKNMRGGARLVEWTLSHFGVRVPDARLQRAEYLGGCRRPVMVTPVEQNSASDLDGTALGTLAGRGTVSGKVSGFKKSFVEHGYIIGICCFIPRTIYSQGIDRHWLRKTRYEEPLPVFAHLGERAMENQEIYAQGTDEDTGTFGYTPQYQELRHIPSKVCGQFRPAGSLNYWTLARQFDSLPTLSEEFIQSDPSNRIFAVEDNSTDHITGITVHKVSALRPFPKYGTPGLIDHD